MLNSSTAALPGKEDAAINHSPMVQGLYPIFQPVVKGAACPASSTATVSPIGENLPRTLHLWCSPGLCQAARILAGLRTHGHDAVRKPSEDLGAAKNLEADFRGLLAEMVVILAAERWGLAPYGFEFVSNRPVSGADFRISNLSYDVKTATVSSRFLCCNERQRLSLAHAGVDFLLPTAFTSPDQLAIYKPIPYADVATWTLREGQAGRQDYRSISLETLKPITCLRNLTEVK